MKSQDTQSCGLKSVSKFLQEIGKSNVTFYRWRKRGWIAEPVNIAGRLYLRETDIAEFYRRAEAGEFACAHKAPKRGE